MITKLKLYTHSGRMAKITFAGGQYKIDRTLDENTMKQAHAILCALNQSEENCQKWRDADA